MKHCLCEKFLMFHSGEEQEKFSAEVFVCVGDEC